MENELFAHVRPYSTDREESGSDLLLSAVTEFLDGFAWANRSGHIWVGECIPGVMGIFLVELDPPGPEIDTYIWVIVGDLPPAYISSFYARSPRAALDVYIGEMGLWVEAVENGEDTGDLIPVNAAPTRENAEALRSRLAVLEREILPELPGSRLEQDRTGI